MAMKSFVTTGATYGCMVDGGTGIDKEIKEIINNTEGAKINGPFCTPVPEPVPTHEKGGCEIVYPGFQSPHNTWIVLGRDRPESLASGCGGKGDTKCGMIDLVVGKASAVSAKRSGGTSIIGKLSGGGPGCELKQEDVAGPNFISDAARIYITQKTLAGKDGLQGGIDSYLGLPDLIGAGDSGNKSAIAIKADHTRIVGRECVRIYCGSSKNVEGSLFESGGETCANGDELEAPKIELIAGSASDVQPVVLGDNLKEYLENHNKIVYRMLDSLAEAFKQLAWINGQIAILTMGMGPNILFAIEDLLRMGDSWIQTINTLIQEVNSLDKLLIKGGNSIFSNTVFTT